MTCSISAKSSRGTKRSPAPLPAIAKASRRRAVLAGLLAGEDAWAEATAITDLPRESGFGFLSARAMRAVRAEAWEG